MKVRIGISLGPNGTPDSFAASVDLLEQAGVDSLAGLAPARVLPVFGLRPARDNERALFPVPEGKRAAVFDESLVLLRMLLTSERVSFDGEFYQVSDVGIGPLPGKPMDIWLGGSAPAGLRRIGRLADGWLGSFLTPPEAGEAVKVIQEAAAEAGREVEPDHFGLSVGVTFGPIPDALASAVGRLSRPGVDPSTLVASGWDGARRMISQYVGAGLTKFVVRPVTPCRLEEFLAGFVRELMPLQTQ